MGTRVARVARPPSLVPRVLMVCMPRRRRTSLQALATLSQPSNLPHGVALLHALVDDVWALAAKDTSADATTAWYTRRAALAG